MYHYLKEIERMPSTEQVMNTMPQSLKEKYPITLAIIGASEIFIETPSDLHIQSSTGVATNIINNTYEFLIGCIPNGSVHFPLVCWINIRYSIKCIYYKGKSVMADCGFTIKDQLAAIGVSLNIPPLMEGQQQLPAEEVQQGRNIASLCIHVERAIGRIKTFIFFGVLFQTHYASITLCLAK